MVLTKVIIIRFGKENSQRSSIRRVDKVKDGIFINTVSIVEVNYYHNDGNCDGNCEND